MQIAINHFHYIKFIHSKPSTTTKQKYNKDKENLINLNNANYKINIRIFLHLSQRPVVNVLLF